MTSRSLLTRSRTGRGVAPPSGRAVVGGLVVTVAALALYGLGTSAASPPRVAVLAATRPIAPGATITVDDVTTVEIDAPADTVDELLAPPDLAAADVDHRAARDDREAVGAQLGGGAVSVAN